jgi:hypothetical protein
MALIVPSGSANGHRQLSGARVVARTSAGIPYVILDDFDAGDGEIWKGNLITPTTFTSVGVPITGVDAGSCSFAIDSGDIIHVVGMDDNGKTSTLIYQTLDTSDDSFGTPTTVISDIGSDPLAITGLHTSIAVDSNDIPHIAYLEYRSNMGTDWWSVYYNNRIGGSWNGSSTQIEGQSAERQCRYPQIVIDADDFPCISYSNETDNDVGTAQCDANDGASGSWTLYDLDTDLEQTGGQFSTSLCVDSEGNHWVAYRRDTDTYIYLRKHSFGVSWTTWGGRLTNDNVGENPSIAVRGTDIYVFYEDDVDDIVWDKFDQTNTIDEYYELGDNDTNHSLSGTYGQVGQSVTGDGQKLKTVVVQLKKSASPTGDIKVELYAHSGTFGTSSIPTGSVLATSTTYASADLTASYHEYSFNFATPYTLANGTKYVIVVDFTGGGGADVVHVGVDGSSPTHGGNFCENLSGTYTPNSAKDVLFRLIPEEAWAGETTVETGTYNNVKVRDPLGGTSRYDVEGSYEISGATANQIYGSGGTNEAVSQSFKIARTIGIKTVWLRIWKTGSPTDVLSVSVRSTEDGSILGTEVTTPAASYGSAAVYPFTVDTPDITADTTYYIQCERSGSRDTSNYLSVGILISAGYPNGGARRKNSGTWGSLATYSSKFNLILNQTTADYTFADETGDPDIWFNTVDITEEAGATSVEKTFTVDAYLKLEDQTKTFTVDTAVSQEDNLKTFTVDAHLANVVTKTFTVDAYLQGTILKTFTADAYIQQLDQTKTFTVDAYLVLEDQLKTFTADAYVQNADVLETFTVDAWLSGTITKTFTADAYLKLEDQLKTFTVDARIVNVVTKTFTVDAAIQDTFTKTFTIDAYLVNEDVVKTFTSDAYLKQEDVLEAFTVDAHLIQEDVLKTFTVDAMVQRLDLTQTFTIDAYLVQEDQTKTFTVDAQLTASGSVEFTVDAWLSGTITKTFTTDAYLIKEDQTKTFTVDAQLIRSGTKEFTVDAWLTGTFTKEFTSDAYLLQEDVLKAFTVDALLQAQDLLKTFTADAHLIQEDVLKTFTVDALLQAQNNLKTFTIDAYLVVEDNTKTFTSDAYLLGSILKTFTVDAPLLKTGQIKTFTVDAQIGIPTGVKEFTVDAWLVNRITKDFTVDSYLLKEDVSETFTIDAYLLSVGTKVFTIDAYVGLSNVLTIKKADIEFTIERMETGMRMKREETKLDIKKTVIPGGEDMLYVDEVYRFQVEIRDSDDALFDPATSVTMTALVTSTTKVDAQAMTNDGVGVYYYDVSFDTAGRWHFTVTATDNTIVNIEKFSLKVNANT